MQLGELVDSRLDFRGCSCSHRAREVVPPLGGESGLLCLYRTLPDGAHVWNVAHVG